MALLGVEVMRPNWTFSRLRLGLQSGGFGGLGQARETEGLSAVVAGEVGLKLPGGEQHLGDAAQFGRILTGIDGPGAGFERELARKGEAVQRTSHWL